MMKTTRIFFYHTCILMFLGYYIGSMSVFRFPISVLYTLPVQVGIVFGLFIIAACYVFVSLPSKVHK